MEDFNHDEDSHDPSTTTILVVDDEPGFVKIVREILESRGYRVHEANSVPQAVLKLEQIVPEVIIVDIMMPQIDGLQLVEKLASDPKWLGSKIIVSSAKVEADDRMGSWERGADAFLPKPFLSQDLLDVIEYVLE